MDSHTRLLNADAQSQELLQQYLHLQHRMQDLTELTESIRALHEQLTHFNTEIRAVQQEVERLQTQLPTLARREELDHLAKQLDTIPFEQFATRRDV
jgi:hypothetical protein